MDITVVLRDRVYEYMIFIFIFSILSLISFTAYDDTPCLLNSVLANLCVNKESESESDISRSSKAQRILSRI